jgi:hypothetical protein
VQHPGIDAGLKRGGEALIRVWDRQNSQSASSSS